MDPAKFKPGSQFMNITAFGTRGQAKFHELGTGYVYKKDIPRDMVGDMNWQPMEHTWEHDPTWAIPTARVIHDFLAAIKEGREPLTGITSAVTVTKMMYAIPAAHFSPTGRVTFPLKYRENPFRH